MTDFDIQIAGRTLAQEARGESMQGQQAVAYVIKNRLIAGRWGKSLASVCLWRAQFSGWYSPNDPNFAYACNLPSNDPTLSHMQSVMQAAMDSETDPTNGALFYYAASINEPPVWVDETQFCGQFGSQRFFRGTK